MRKSKRRSRKRVSRKRVSPFRAQRPALSRKRVSRKRVSKRGSRRRRSRNYRMRGSRTHPVPKCENLGRKACKKASHCKYKYIKNHPRGGKCERKSIDCSKLGWMNLTGEPWSKLPQDLRDHIFNYKKYKMQNIIDQTVNILENKLGEIWDSLYYYRDQFMSDKIIAELKILLEEYLNKSTLEEKLFSAECWGGGVWDRLYHYNDPWKPVLVSNYHEMKEAAENCGRVSPIMNDFPYQELSDICVSNIV